MLGLSKCTISSVSTWKTSADQSDAMLCGYPRQFDKIRITQKEHKLERKVLAFFFVGNEYEWMVEACFNEFRKIILFAQFVERFDSRQQWILCANEDKRNELAALQDNRGSILFVLTKALPRPKMSTRLVRGSFRYSSGDANADQDQTFKIWKWWNAAVPNEIDWITTVHVHKKPSFTQSRACPADFLFGDQISMWESFCRAVQ